MTVLITSVEITTKKTEQNAKQKWHLFLVISLIAYFVNIQLRAPHALPLVNVASFWLSLTFDICDVFSKFESEYFY
jgi:hypothetical protein